MVDLLYLIGLMIAALALIALSITGIIVGGLLAVVGVVTGLVGAILERKLWAVLITGIVCATAVTMALIVVLIIY